MKKKLIKAIIILIAIITDVIYLFLIPETTDILKAFFGSYLITGGTLITLIILADKFLKDF